MVSPELLCPRLSPELLGNSLELLELLGMAPHGGLSEAAYSAWPVKSYVWCPRNSLELLVVSPELLVSGTPPFDKNNLNEWENALTNAVLQDGVA